MNKESWTTDAINNMDDLKDDYTGEEKGQDKKKEREYALCDQMYIKFREYLGMWGSGRNGGLGLGREITKQQREPTGVLDVFIVLIVTPLTYPTGQGDHYLEFSGHLLVTSMSSSKN